MNINSLKGLFLGFLATFSWASSYIVSRYFFGTDTSGLDPLWISFLRYFLSSAVLCLFLAASKHFGTLIEALRKDWRSLLIMGAVGVAAESTLLFYSAKYTTAARSNLLTNISPVVTAIMSYFVTREAFGARRITGMMLGFAGMLAVFFLRGGDDFSGNMVSMLAGDVMAMLAGVCWSAYTVWGKKLVDDHGGITAACGCFISGTLCMIPVMLVGRSHITFDISLKPWLMILYLGIVPGAVGNTFWYLALKYLKPGELGAFGYISVFLTVILSIVCLGEHVSALFVGCLAVILMGTGMMMRNDKKGKT